ncbi:MAG: hypothetical protein ACXITV_12115 [Luteibaculaceae bacterium]
MISPTPFLKLIRWSSLSFFRIWVRIEKTNNLLDNKMAKFYSVLLDFWAKIEEKQRIQRKYPKVNHV